MYLLTPFCIKVTNKADIWALGIVLYQWAYNEKHPYETLPGGKISRIKGGLISELFFLGSTQCPFFGDFCPKIIFHSKSS